MTDTLALTTSNGSTPQPVPAYVHTKGYLPPATRTKPGHSVMLNRFPLGDMENFSVSRVCLARGQELLGKSHDYAWQKDAPWEKAYYDALAEIEYKAQGEYVSGQDGGFLAPEVWSGPYFGLLRSFGVLDQLPITRISVPARIVHIPKVTNEVTETYQGENASITTSGFLFGGLSYTARKATHLMAVSNEMIRDAAEMADQVLRIESAAAHALDRDTKALIGNGGNDPMGLVTLAGAASVTTGTVAKYYPGASATAAISTTPAHGIPSFLHVSGLRDKVHQLNGSTKVTAGQAHCNGIIAHSRIEAEIFVLTGAAGPWTDGQGRPLWMSGLGGPQETLPDRQSGNQNGLMGQVWALTNILPTNSTDGGGTASSFIIAGWWDMFVLFEANAFIYDATVEGGAFQSDQTYIRAIHRFDCGPAHPEAFAILAGCD